MLARNDYFLEFKTIKSVNTILCDNSITDNRVFIVIISGTENMKIANLKVSYKEQRKL